ncbi:hypothetical protein ACHWQZ_G001106 [Mnemiopsis leidyi]
MSSGDQISVKSDSLAWTGVLVTSKKLSNVTVKCIYCDHSFTGSVTRIRCHFLGSGTSCTVKRCTALKAIPDTFMDGLKDEEYKSRLAAEAKAKKRKLIEAASQKTVFDCSSKKSLLSATTEFFLAEAIPFSKVDSVFFKNMIRCAAAAGNSASHYLPCRQTLGSTHTEEKYEQVRAIMTVVTHDRPEHTIVCDGWKNAADEPTSVFLQAWNDTNVYLETFYTAGERRTSDATQVLREESLDIGLKLFVSLSLLAEDIVGKIPVLDEVAENAKKVVNYVRSHNLLAGTLKKESQKILLNPNDTRFGTTILLMDRLLELKTEVTQLFHSDKADELLRSFGRVELKERFKQVLKIVQDLSFWDDVRYVLRLVLPILHLIRLCDNYQGTGADAVGNIYAKMLELQEFYRLDPEIKNDHRSKLSEFLSCRWGMLHSPLMDAGYLLNPAYLSHKPWTVQAVMDGTLGLVRKWDRFLTGDVSGGSELVIQVTVEVHRYIEVAGANDFAKKISTPQSLEDMLATFNIPPAEREIACRDNSKTAEMYWRVYGARTPILQKLANIIFRQPVSQSAAEQSLSGYKRVMPESRASLSRELQHKAVYTYHNIRTAKKFQQLGYC